MLRSIPYITLWVRRLHALREGAPLDRRTIEVHFDVPDVDAAYEALRVRGVSFERPLQTMPWGSRQAWMRDPEGYHVELVGPLTPGELVVPE